jgi:hypothetical protein
VNSRAVLDAVVKGTIPSPRGEPNPRTFSCRRGGKIRSYWRRRGRGPNDGATDDQVEEVLPY